MLLEKNEWDSELVSYYENGNIKSKILEKINDDNKRYILILKWNDNSFLINQKWLKNGKKHKKNGPAYITYDNLGQIITENWYKNGKLHRENGPAVIHYDINKIRMIEIWYKNGRLYRDDGPVIIHRNKDNIITKKRFCNKNVEKELDN